MKKALSVIGLTLVLVMAFSVNAQASDDVNVDSMGSIIKHVKAEYEKDSSPEGRRQIAEWLTKVVDDRLINSNSAEWFSRPVYAWLAVYYVRNDPSNTGEYWDQANSAWSRGYGNCGENSVVVYYILKKAGVKENVRYLQAGKNRSHSFTAWGIPPTAQLSDPTTWGDGIVVDPWVGDVLTGQEVRDDFWFQNGNPDAPIYDGTKSVDYEADDWQLIQKREEHRTGQKIEPDPVENEIDSLLGDCFIATAVYGTPRNEEINTLRAFRDQTLRNHVLGRAFIKTYETFGPVAANIIRPDESKKTWARAYVVEPALKLVKHFQ